MKYQVALNQNGKIMDVIVEEANNLQEAKILASHLEELYLKIAELEAKVND